MASCAQRVVPISTNTRYTVDFHFIILNCLNYFKKGTQVCQLVNNHVNVFISVYFYMQMAVRRYLFDLRGPIRVHARQALELCHVSIPFNWPQFDLEWTSRVKLAVTVPINKVWRRKSIATDSGKQVWKRCDEMYSIAVKIF